MELLKIIICLLGCTLLSAAKINYFADIVPSYFLMLVVSFAMIERLPKPIIILSWVSAIFASAFCALPLAYTVIVYSISALFVMAFSKTRLKTKFWFVPFYMFVITLIGETILYFIFEAVYGDYMSAFTQNILPVCIMNAFVSILFYALLRKFFFGFRSKSVFYDVRVK